MLDKPTLTPAELLELRNRLDDIDTGIVDLIAERQAVVTAIGEHKLKTGAPLRHYAREREVIDRGMARAESHGLPGAVARDVLETLIHHSLSNQETYKLVQSDHGAGKSALVIGGLGRMGEWMCRYLDMVGYHVDVADPVEKETPFHRIDDWESRADDYDMIVVAVPLRPSNDILLRLAELKPGRAGSHQFHKSGRAPHQLSPSSWTTTGISVSPERRRNRRKALTVLSRDWLR